MSTLPSQTAVDAFFKSQLRVDPRKVALIQKPYIKFHQLAAARRWWQILPHVIARQYQRFYLFAPPKWRVTMRSLNANRRMKPSFASIGAVRSGTSILSSYILQHPHVVLPLAKEIGNAWNMRDLMAHFPSRNAQRLNERRHGGAITGYCTPAVPNMLFSFLMKSMFPDLRVIIILRNPVDRVYSHWLWDQRNFFDKRRSDPFWKGYPNFETIVQIETETIRSGGTGVPALSGVGATGAGYLHHSIYSPFLRVLLDQFGREQVYIVNASEFFVDPHSVMKEIFEFLGVPPVQPIVIEERNAGPPGVLSDSTRSTLAEFFRPYNEDLYKLVGKDFGWESSYKKTQEKFLVRR